MNLCWTTLKEQLWSTTSFSFPWGGHAPFFGVGMVFLSVSAQTAGFKWTEIESLIGNGLIKKTSLI